MAPNEFQTNGVSVPETVPIENLKIADSSSKSPAATTIMKGTTTAGDPHMHTKGVRRHLK
jgi:hypothetical protein